MSHEDSRKDLLIQEFEKLLGDGNFFNVAALVRIGFFGSAPAGTAALNRGDLPYIRVGRKRRIVPRSALLKYFSENLKAY